MTNDDPNEVYEVMPIEPGPRRPPKGWWIVKRNGLLRQNPSISLLDHGRRPTMISCGSSRPRVSAQERSVSG
jgi:hypothetical protein